MAQSAASPPPAAAPFHEACAAMLGDHPRLQRLWRLCEQARERLVSPCLAHARQPAPDRPEPLQIVFADCEGSGPLGASASGDYVAAFVNPPPRIVVCRDRVSAESEAGSRLLPPAQVAPFVLHELVHYLDYLSLEDLTACQALACSEVRAYRVQLGALGRREGLVRRNSVRRMAVHSVRPLFPEARRCVRARFDECYRSAAPLE